MNNPEKYWEDIMGYKQPQGKVRRILLELLRTIYRTVQAAMVFFWELLKAFKYLKYSRSKADPCLHYK